MTEEDLRTEEMYIVSIWENHKSPNEWLYDICPIEQFFRSSYKYITEYKKPYYYTPIFKGTHKDCIKAIEELKREWSKQNDRH